MKDEIAGTIYAKEYTDWHIKTGGFARDMTLRDYFAGQILRLYSDDKPNHMRLNAEQAYVQADYALKERIKDSAKENQSSLDGWDLTVRVCNCLKAEGIYTVSDLLSYTQSDLKRIPNMGRKSVKEVVVEAALRGFIIKEYK
jgi:DNA-directed RNA polymerase alpha subunit